MFALLAVIGITSAAVREYALLIRTERATASLRSRVVFLLARLVPSLLGVVTTAVLTRLLKPAEYGVYALGLSIVFLLTIGVFEWLGLSLLRLAPMTRRPARFFGTIVTCFNVLCLFCTVVASLLWVFGQLDGYAALVMACLVATFASAWVELNQRLQLAELRDADFFRTSFGRSVVSMALITAAAYFFHSPPLILLALGAGGLVAAALVRESRLSLFRCRFDPALCRRLLGFGIPLSVSVGLATVLMSVDKWLLQGLSGPHAVGLYSAATLVAQVPIMTLAGGIGPSAYSMAVRALEFGSPEATRRQLEQNFTVLLGTVVPAAVGIIAVSSNLAHLIVGHAFWDAVVRLAPWLAGTAVLASLRAFYVDIAFQLAHRTSPLIWTMLVAVGVNVALDIWLIPDLGELGAAIGSFGALFVALLVAALLSRRIFILPVPLADAGKILASAGAMYSVLHAVSGYSGTIALAVQMFVGAVIYLGGILAFDIRGLRELLARELQRLRR